MSLSETAIRQPVSVAVGVILLVLAGVVALQRIPVQLTPNVEDTIISVSTIWEGASPQEIEQEIVEPQEEMLQGLANLREMTATCQQGLGRIRLEFNVGTDKDVALREVSDKLRQVPEYPDNVEEPVVEASDPENRDYIAWIIFECTDPKLDVRTFNDFVEDRVEPVLERVPGISEINVLGGTEREVQIQFDAAALAQRGITLNEFVNTIRRTNRNISAGELEDAKQNVRVRTVSQYTTVEEVENTVLSQGVGGTLRVRDVATVVETFKEPTTFVRSRGKSVIAINAQKEIGANVIEVMAGLLDAVDYLNRKDGVLDSHARKLGLDGDLSMKLVYDQTIYIDDALYLVRNNLWLGGTLAILILLLFLRSLRSAAIVALAIPISIMGTIVAMVALGRNVNVISLAGMAFAVGMVVDNAIVVLENVYRHLEMGKSPLAAARAGAREVWGAVLAATLTTVAVFIPILLIQDEAGQLFRDIALAICSAVLLSLVVSMTVIPAAAARWLGGVAGGKGILGRAIGWIAIPFRIVPRSLGKLVYLLCGSFLVRVIVVAVLTAASILGTRWLAPPADYLPTGNRNLVFGLLIPPPGYSLTQQELLSGRIEETMRPFFEAGAFEPDDPRYSAAAAELPEIPTFDFARGAPGPSVTPPPLENYFIVSFDGLMFHGGIAREPKRASELGPLFMHATRAQVTPGVFGFAFQVPLFQLGGRTGSAVEINFSGPDLEAVTGAALGFFLDLMGRYGPGTVQPDPSNFNIPGPELQVIPNWVRLSQVGLTAEDLGIAVQARGDGAIIGEYRVDGDTIDLKLIESESVDQEYIGPLGDLALATPDGQIVSLDSVARLLSTTAPQQINHVGRQRAVTLQFTAPPGLALEEAVGVIDGLIAEKRQSGAIPPTVEISFSGSASKLESVRSAMLGDGTILGSLNSSMVQALAVVYLLLCVLFQSFLRPLVIMLSVPLATLGGFAALALVHAWSSVDPYMPVQNLDVLTMLGFLILIGVVVNNAILIVHQALNFMAGGPDGEPLPPREAIAEAVRTRVRPIFMGTLTSIGGMAPLVLMPGSGSELYRGLGSVVLGGLLVSTIFTLLLVPLLFSLVVDITGWFRRRRVEESAGTPATSSANVLLMLALPAVLVGSGCVSAPSSAPPTFAELIEQTLRDESVGTALPWEPQLESVPADSDLSEHQDELLEMAGPQSYGELPPLYGRDLLGNVPTVRAVNREGAIYRALRSNLGLRSAQLEPLIAGEQLVVASSEFDAAVFSEFDLAKVDEPTAVPILNGVVLGPRVNANERETLRAGVRFRSQRWGSTATISGLLDRFENDIPGFTLSPEPTYTARAALELSQPLLRGFGRDANEAEIELSRNARERAIAQLANFAQVVVLDVEEAYFDLVLAHQTLRIQQRLLQRGQDVERVLELRQDFDAERSQFADAVAVVQQRRSELVRAQALVQRASDRLKFLLNDPEFPLAGEALLQPELFRTPDSLRLNLGEAVRTALAGRPEVESAVLDIEDSQIRQRLAKNLRLPQLDVAAGVTWSGLDDAWGESIDEIDGRSFVSYTLGLVFEVPFGNRGPRADLRRRNLEAQQSVIEARRVMRQVILDVKTSLRDLKTSYELLRASRASRIAQSENLRALLVEEETRSALTPEFLNLKFQRQERLALAEVQEAVAEADYQRAEAAYRRALGTGVPGKLDELLEAN